jgi:hypothetical protein
VPASRMTAARSAPLKLPLLGVSHWGMVGSSRMVCASGAGEVAPFVGAVRREVDAGGKLHTPCMRQQNLNTRLGVRQIDVHCDVRGFRATETELVEPTGSQHGGVDNVRAVRGADDKDLL